MLGEIPPPFLLHTKRRNAIYVVTLARATGAPTSISFLLVEDKGRWPLPYIRIQLKVIPRIILGEGKSNANYLAEQKKTDIFAKNSMDKKDLLYLFKFYREEEKNPFIVGTLSSKWWEGEKAFLNLITEDKDALARIIEHLKDAIKEGAATAHLIDNTINIEQRALYYYLDLWNGKNYPYDSLDDIFDYVRAKPHEEVY